MICWVIKHKGKGFVADPDWNGESNDYGKLINAVFYPTKKEAMKDTEYGDDVVKIEIKVLD